MTSEEIHNCKLIDELIRQKRSFAIYRIPGEEYPHFLMQSSGSARLIYEMDDLNGADGFVIAPFHVSSGCPIALIRPDCFVLSDQTVLSVDSGNLDGTPDSGMPLEPVLSSISKDADRLDDDPKSSFDAYSRCFDLFITALRRKEFDKLVLSRHLSVSRPAGFSPATSFFKACRKYIYSYVYLSYTPRTGVWMGSTPEIILSGENGKWNTVALAGTQSLKDGKLPSEWDDKNREEQEYVAAYIRRQLQSLGIRSVEQGPYSAFAGALSHLKTDFRFSLSGQNELGSLLNLLHPTPAVCGLPKEEAYRFILANEGYDRSYYSGFIGWLDPEGRTDLYVNLRCMNIREDVLTLYAGGGLLASSELEDEYLETEKKMQTMMNLLQPD